MASQTKSRNASEMRALIAAQQSSGKTAKQFCQENDLKRWTFSYWKCRLRELDAKAARKRFVEVKAKPKPPAPSLKVLINSELKIEVPSSFDSKALRALVEVLKTC